MQLHAGQTVHLMDAQQRCLGKVVVEKVEERLVLGTFAPEPDFARVEPLFSEFVEAANQQLFHRLDELDASITVLGLRLASINGVPLPAIEDVQIANGNISFRIGGTQPQEGLSLADESSRKER